MQYGEQLYHLYALQKSLTVHLSQLRIHSLHPFKTGHDERIYKSSINQITSKISNQIPLKISSPQQDFIQKYLSMFFMTFRLKS